MSDNAKVQNEVEECAHLMMQELTGGKIRPEDWHLWYLCERHGGAPVIAKALPAGQIAYWDGEDIVLDGGAPLADLLDALPEELAHRLSYDSARFESLNYALLHSHALQRSDFQERLGQCIAELWQARRVGI